VQGLPPPVQEEIEFEEPVAPILCFNLQNDDDPPTDEQMDDNTLVTQSMSRSQNSWKAKRSIVHNEFAPKPGEKRKKQKLTHLTPEKKDFNMLIKLGHALSH
jgi:hypothetical protein